MSNLVPYSRSVEKWAAKNPEAHAALVAHTRMHNIGVMTKERLTKNTAYSCLARALSGDDVALAMSNAEIVADYKIATRMVLYSYGSMPL